MREQKNYCAVVNILENYCTPNLRYMCLRISGNIQGSFYAIWKGTLFNHLRHKLVNRIKTIFD